jgi:hypothetical protein
MTAKQAEQIIQRLGNENAAGPEHAPPARTGDDLCDAHAIAEFVVREYGQVLARLSDE